MNVSSRSLSFQSDGETLAGELVLPDGAGPHPAVLLIGGTLSDTRDGDPAASLQGRLPTHGMFRIMADHLGQAGLASLRWDKRGVAESSGPDRELHSDIQTDVADAERAFETLIDQPEVDVNRVAVLGESAGAYFACLLAEREDRPAAYVLQGVLYDDIPEMLAFNYDRLARFMARGPKEFEYVRQNLPRAYDYAQHWREIIDAARQGKAEIRIGEGAEKRTFYLARTRQELERPPESLLEFIRTPVLVIQGDRDMNVPPDNCRKAAEKLRQAGNQQVTLVVVPGADHSMQLAPDDEQIRIWERISFESFQRPYSQFFLGALSGWLLDRLRDSPDAA